MTLNRFPRPTTADFADRGVTRNVTISAGSASLDVGGGAGFTDAQWDLVEKSLRQQRALMQKHLQSRYRLEIRFREKEKSGWRPMFGGLSFWEGAAAAYGGGSQKVYLCPVTDCRKPLPNNAAGGGLFACPHCNKAWTAEEVVGEVYARLSAPRWADLILVYFKHLGLDADLILRTQPVGDIRVLSEAEQQRDRGGDLLEPHRDGRIPVVYPLRRIVADLHAGSDLRSRFLAFIRS